MQRRSFLAGMLAAAAAPAIIRASSLMPVWVPKKEIVHNGLALLNPRGRILPSWFTEHPQCWESEFFIAQPVRGQLFLDRDTDKIYYHTGTAWEGMVFVKH